MMNTDQELKKLKEIENNNSSTPKQLDEAAWRFLIIGQEMDNEDAEAHYRTCSNKANLARLKIRKRYNCVRRKFLRYSVAAGFIIGIVIMILIIKVPGYFGVSDYHETHFLWFSIPKDTRYYGFMIDYIFSSWVATFVFVVCILLYVGFLVSLFISPYLSLMFLLSAFGMLHILNLLLIGNGYVKIILDVIFELMISSMLALIMTFLLFRIMERIELQ